jgi:ribosomal-protein-alanine N-acetyltransferase
VKIRPLEARDIASVLEIQAACPEIAQWTTWDYDRVARGEMAGWVAAEEVHDGEMAGFIVARRVANDIEILNFAVRLDARRHGVGTLLLEQALAWARSCHADSVFLEVRASNEAALRFYERHRFESSGRRTRYYIAPIEDAVLLSARLT